MKVQEHNNVEILLHTHLQFMSGQETIFGIPVEQMMMLELGTSYLVQDGQVGPKSGEVLVVIVIKIMEKAFLK